MPQNRQRYFIHLFNFFTIGLWAWFFFEFITKGGADVPRSLGDIYLLVLGYYAGDKEIHRWRHRHRSVPRRGEYFVVGWAVTLLLMLIIEILDSGEHGYRVPDNMAFVVGGVLVIFFVTEYLKSEFGRKR